MSASFFLAMALVAVASAHMGVKPDEITPGGRATVAVTIGHDCGDKTVGTSNFTIVIPDRFISVKVEDTPGWHIVIHEVMLEPPVVIGDRTPVNKTVRAVEYHGFLPDGYYKTFGLKVQANEEVAVGDVVYWKGYQHCPPHGDEMPLLWEAISKEGEERPPRPATPMDVVAEIKEG